MFVCPQSVNLTMAGLLASASGAAGPFHSSKLHLFSNNFQPSRTSVLADFTEADFTGYAATTVVWGSVANDTGGGARLPGTSIEFLATDAVHPNTIYGWYLTDSAGTVLLGSSVLPDPVAVLVANDACIVAPIIPLNLNAA